MRQALNNNPMVQLAVLAVLLLVVGVMLAPQLLHHGGSGGSSAPTTTSSAQLSTPTGSVDLSVESSGSLVPPGTGAAPTSGSAQPSAGSISPSALVPGPGLPRPLVSAWHHGDAVVVLVIRDGGVDDRLVRRAVSGLAGDSGVAVFVVRASHIARYSRITQGVGVSQVPAMVVVRPRRLSGSVPQAQVAYGFRNAQSVVQQVHDALYSGKDNLPYSPR